MDEVGAASKSKFSTGAATGFTSFCTGAAFVAGTSCDSVAGFCWSAIVTNSLVSTRPSFSSTFFWILSTRNFSVLADKVRERAVRQHDREDAPVELHGVRYGLLAAVAPVRAHHARDSRVHLHLRRVRMRAAANAHGARRGRSHRRHGVSRRGRRLCLSSFLGSANASGASAIRRVIAVPSSCSAAHSRETPRRLEPPEEELHLTRHSQSSLVA